MKQPLFTGACTALVTPFLNNAVNYPLLQQLIANQIEAGIPAVVLAGTTGESPVLSDMEKLELFKRGKQYAKDRCLVIAGTGSNCTEHAIALSVAAEAVGVDGLLIVAPYYNKGNPDSLYRHFASIAAAVHIPVIVYNVPGRTGVDIPVSVYQRLSRIPNIIGVKEASSDITKTAKIRCACGDDFFIWSGNDDQIVPVISMGGKGVISVLSNLYPAQTQTMCAAALSGEYATASKLQCNMMELIGLLFAEVNPIPVKYAMKYVGFDCGDCRLPLGAPGKDLTQRIDAYFQYQSSLEADL